MPSRTYQVNYDIIANTAEAQKAFQGLQSPMFAVSQSLREIANSMSKITTQSREFKSQFGNLRMKPTIDLTDFKRALASAEQNVKESATRIRAAMQSALGGSQQDFKRMTGMLGTNNWKEAEQAMSKNAMRSMRKRYENLEKVRRAIINPKKYKEEAEQVARSQGIMQRNAQKFLRENGMGNLIFQDMKKNGQWSFGAGDASTKIKDFVKTQATAYQKEFKNWANTVRSNARRDMAFQRSMGKSSGGSWVGGLLGVTPEELKQLETSVGTMRSIMNQLAPVQQQAQTMATQTRQVQKQVLSSPLKYTGVAKQAAVDIKALQKESEMLGKQLMAGKSSIPATNPFAKALQISEKNYKAAKSQFDGGALPKSMYDEFKSKYEKALAASQRWDNNLARKQAIDRQITAASNAPVTPLTGALAPRSPFKTITQTITEPVKQVQQATARPFEFNITGNFASRIQDVVKIAQALTIVPREPINIPLNVTGVDGLATKLNDIKLGLQGINRARKSFAKGSNRAFNRVMNTISNTNVPGSLLIGSKYDQAAAGGVANTMQRSISNLRKLANEHPITVKLQLYHRLYADLEKVVTQLKNYAAENVIQLQMKMTSKGLLTQLKQQLKRLNEASKIPAIKVQLDTTEAQARLKALVEQIKAASPQTIKMTASGTGSRAVNNAVNSGATPATGSSAQVGVWRSARNGRPIPTPMNNAAERASERAATTSATRGRAAGTGSRTYRMTPVPVRTTNKENFAARIRRGLYPFTGNTSFGASTPVALDMAKGMGMMYGVGGAMNFVTGGLTEAMEYQNTMETAKAILQSGYKGNNFSGDFNDMAQEVRDVAKKTKFTAPQAADATRFMAMAGLDIPKIKASVRPVADVAVIGDNDFGEVADKITNIQTAFALKPAQMRHLADALTKTFTSSNTDMMMLAESMQYAGPMAHLTGMSLDDTLAMIGIMGNAGIQASMAGTTLRMMMQNTLNPNKKQAALWKRLGVSTRQKDGSMRNMIDILADVKTAQEKQKLPIADVVSGLFRVTASAGAGALMENLGQVRELAAANRASAGISESISLEKQNTVKGLWYQMTSAFTEANLQVFERFQEDIKDMIKAMRDYFSSREAVENLRSVFDLIKSLMGMFGRFAKIWMGLYNTFPNLIKSVILFQMAMTNIGYLIKPFGSFINAAGGIGTLLGIGGKAGASAVTIAGGSLASTFGRTGIAAGGAGRYAAIGGALEAMKLRQMQFERKGNILTNSVPQFGSQTGNRLPLSPMMFVNPSGIPRDQFEWKYKRQMFAGLRAKDQAAQIARERMALISSARRADQLSNLGLMYFAANRRPGRFREVEAIVNPIREKNQQIAALRHANRGIADSSVLYRAGRLYNSNSKWTTRFMGGMGAVIKGGFTAGFTALSTASLFASIKSGFVSVIGGLSKAIGLLVGPIAAAVAAIGALGVAAWGFYKGWQREKQKQLQNAENTKQIRNQGASILDTYNAQVKKLDNDFKNPFYKGSTGGIIRNLTDAKTVFGGNGGNKSAILGKNFSAISNIDPNLFDASKRKAIYDNYIKANFDVMGGPYSRVMAGRYGNISDSGKGFNSSILSYSAAIGAPRTTDNFKQDQLNKMKKDAAVSSIFRAGAMSKEAMDVRKKIYDIYSKATSSKDAYTQSIQLIDKVFGNDSALGYYGVKDATNSSYGQIINSGDLSEFKQYRQGASQSLFNMLENAKGTSLGVVKGMLELKNKLQPYTTEWYKAMANVASGMQLMFEDSKGKIHNLTLKFSDNMTPEWTTLYKQLNDLHINFGNSLRNHISVLGSIARQMMQIPGFSEYIKQIGGIKEWLYRQIKQMQDIKDKYGLTNTLGNNQWSGSEWSSDGKYSMKAYNKYVRDFQAKNGLVAQPLSYQDWKKREKQKDASPILQDNKSRKELASVIDSEIDKNEDFKKIQKQEQMAKDLEKLTNGGSSDGGGGGGYTSPLASASDTNRGLGRSRYTGATARPTQINITVQNLANFDKVQFLQGKEREMLMAIEGAVAEAVSNLVPMVNSLANNDRGMGA